MDKFEKFKKDFQNLSKDEQIKIFDEFCDKNELENKKIYPMEKFDEVFANVKPSDIFEWVWCNSEMIERSDDYFQETCYCFKTINYPYDEVIHNYIRRIFDSTQDMKDKH